jgi:hypothetical protein
VESQGDATQQRGLAEHGRERVKKKKKRRSKRETDHSKGGTRPIDGTLSFQSKSKT